MFISSRELSEIKSEISHLKRHTMDYGCDYSLKSRIARLEGKFDLILEHLRLTYIPPETKDGRLVPIAGNAK